jgi:ketosteroid isomerase-like protein
MRSEIEARQELEQLYNQWFAALAKRDSAFFERFIADEWIYTDIAGTVRGKKEYLEYLNYIPPDVSFDLTELSVRTYGDVALATGHYFIQGVLADGRDVSSSTRFTGVWIYREDGWQCLAHHATSLGKP